jgi:hypothetical protein
VAVPGIAGAEAAAAGERFKVLRKSYLFDAKEHRASVVTKDSRLRSVPGVETVW